MIFSSPRPLRLVCPAATRIVGDPDRLVSGLGHLGDVFDGMLSFAESRDILRELLKTGCSAVFVRQEDLPQSPDRTLPTVSFCVTATPSYSFSTLVKGLAPTRHPDSVFSPRPEFMRRNAYVSTEAFLAADVDIGDGTQIFPGAYIGANVRIGSGCIISANAVLMDDTMLGHNVFVGPGAVIGAMPNWYYLGDGERRPHAAAGRVVVEDNVTVGANSVIDRGMTGETRIGRGTQIGNLVQIGHESHIGRNCVIVAQVGVSGNVSIGADCRIDAQGGVGAYARLADRTTVGPRAGVTSSVDRPGLILMGFPAIERSLHARREMVWKQRPRLIGCEVDDLWHTGGDPGVEGEDILRQSMGRDSIEELRRIVHQHLREQLSLAEDFDIRVDVAVSGIGGDSLDRIEFAMACEEEFGLSLSEQDWDDATTLWECIRDVAKARLKPVASRVAVAGNRKASFLNVIRVVPGAAQSVLGAKFEFVRDGGLDQYGVAVLAGILEAALGVRLPTADVLAARDVQMLYSVVVRCTR